MAEDKSVGTKKTTAKTAAADRKPDNAPVTKKTSSKKAAAKKTAAAKTSGTPASASTAKKKVTKKTSTKKAAAAKAAPASAPASPPQAPASTKATQARKERPVTLKPVTEVTAEERRRMIEEAAFYIAEKRGFAPGDDAADWAAAEAEIDAQLRKAR